MMNDHESTTPKPSQELWENLDKWQKEQNDPDFRRLAEQLLRRKEQEDRHEQRLRQVAQEFALYDKERQCRFCEVIIWAACAALVEDWNVYERLQALFCAFADWMYTETSHAQQKFDAAVLGEMAEDATIRIKQVMDCPMVFAEFHARLRRVLAQFDDRDPESPQGIMLVLLHNIGSDIHSIAPPPHLLLDMLAHCRGLSLVLERKRWGCEILPEHVQMWDDATRGIAQTHLDISKPPKGMLSHRGGSAGRTAGSNDSQS